MPMARPWTTVPVSIVTVSPATSIGNWSRPRGAGPPFFSPTRLYLEPWHGHSNHCDVWHQGTRQPRWTHFWKMAMTPASSPGRTDSAYTSLARPSADSGYGLMYARASG